MFAGFTHQPAIDLTARILPLLPGKMEKIFFSDNGSTAVEIGLKIALQYWYNRDTPKTKIISFKGGYHGDTFGAMSVAGKTAFNRPFWSHLFEVTTTTPPIKGHEEKSLKQLQAAIDSKTACFIFEPLVLGVSGMLMYTPKQIAPLLDLCRKYGVITIADEVMTGFGRTGTYFASDQIHQKPDIICLAKGITGGFLPLGATCCTGDVYDAFHSEDKLKAFLHGHSYTANPLACASAVASLDLLQAKACKNQREMIASSHAMFACHWKNHPKLKRCESLGTILALEYKDSAPSYFSSLRDPLYDFFIQKKIILRPLGNVLYVLPPYCITQSELNQIYQAISQTLEGNL